MVSDSVQEALPATGTIAAEDLARRVMVALGLLGIGLIHLLDTKSKFSETPYLGWAYVLLIGTAVVAAEGIIRRSTPARWMLAGAVGAGPLAGYIVSRTTGLPSATDDVGNWWEPLGIASLFVETAVIVLVVLGLITAGGGRERGASRHR